MYTDRATRRTKRRKRTTTTMMMMMLIMRERERELSDQIFVCNVIIMSALFSIIERKKEKKQRVKSKPTNPIITWSK